MRRVVLLFSILARRFQWGNARGIGLFGLIVAVAALSVSATFLLFSNLKDQGKNPLTGGLQDKNTLSDCVKNSNTQLNILKDVYHPGDEIPADNEQLKAIAACAQQVSTILKNNAGAAPNPEWKQVLDDLQQLIGSKIEDCIFTEISPSSAPVGTRTKPIVLTAFFRTVGKPQGVSDDIAATVQATGGETAQLHRTVGARFEGSITLDGRSRTPFTSDTLTLSAALSGSTLPIVCPTRPFSWTEAVNPSGQLFVQGQAKSGVDFSIVAKVKDADSIRVTGDDGSSYSQACNANHMCQFLQTGVTITKKTVYTLTATQEGKSVTLDTKTVDVQQGSYAITLSASQATDTSAVTETSLFVGGKVTPAPPDGTSLSVTLGVNGTPVLSVPVDSGGVYTASVPLQKVLTSNDVKVINPDITVTSCGPQSTPVSLAVSKSAQDVANVINAAVVAVGGGADSNIASLTVYGAVRVNSTFIDWSGQCPDASETEQGGYIIRPGESRQVATVDCGTECPGNGTDCSATATASVQTSVGNVFDSGLWIVKIP